MSYENPRPVTVEQMEAAVPLLPDALRASLAKGPLPGVHCWICRAFDPDWWQNPDNYNPYDPRWVVFDYHDEPFRTADRNKYSTKKAVYERCMEVYRAVGWTG